MNANCCLICKFYYCRWAISQANLVDYQGVNTLKQMLLYILQLATLSYNCSHKLRNNINKYATWNLLKVQSRRLSPLRASCHLQIPVSLRSTTSFSSSQTDTLYSAPVANHLYATKC